MRRWSLLVVLGLSIGVADGCGTVTNNGDGGTGGTASGGHGGGAAGGSVGSGGQGGHQCSPDPSCACATGPCCGTTCCGPGEWCDTSAATLVCRCGSNAACMDGNTCNAPAVDVSNPCGFICCMGSGCPISRRAFKRDIHQLDRAEIDRLSAELGQIKLATYQYKTDPIASPRRLGFIIDDTKSPYPVNADGASVNLYGYVSMAVAAIQAQSRELEALRSEIARLKKARAR